MQLRNQSLGSLTVTLIISCILSLPCLAANVTIQLGPAATGGGGPNPISIPPTNPLDYEFVWLTEQNTEFAISIFPGVFYGKRIEASNGTYLSLGGGLVINGNGVGPGVYSAFGYQSCSSVCFNAEYKQALGISNKSLINPYAVRLGVSFKLDWDGLF